MAADSIRSLQPETAARIWLSEESNSTSPLAIVTNVSQDKDGRVFSEAVVNGRMRSSKQHLGLRGIIQRTNSGKLVLSTLDPLSNIGEKLTTWLQPFGPIIIARRQKDEIVEAKRIGTLSLEAEISELISHLEQVSKTPCLFWFSRADRTGNPLLLLATDATVLKASALESKGDTPGVRGKLFAAKWGIELRTKKPYPGLLPALAKWVETNRKRWPKVEALIGARVTVRDKAGNIIERTKDDKAWSSLRTKRKK